ncbi:MAG: hypothetical protein U0807_16055 [Candidatus Binatia bacterium]
MQEGTIGNPAVVILDGGIGWEHGEVEGHRVEPLALGTATPESLARIGPALAVVNVASASALATAGRLRAGGCTVPFRGCLALAGAPFALPLGVVEPVAAATDAAAIRAALPNRPRRNTRVLVAGANTDALVALWGSLTRDGISVAIAPEANQADDLLDLVRPNMLVVDLRRPPRGGLSFVGRLGTMAAIPALVLLGEPTDAMGFARSIGVPPATHSLVPRIEALRRLVNPETSPGASPAPPD